MERMGEMSNNVFDNQCRVTMICVDDYSDGILYGRIYNPYFGKEISFSSTMEFLKKLDSMLEKMNFPQSFSVGRVFKPIQEAGTDGPPITGPQTGKIATFALRILFRQNASWQGSISWSEGNQEESFRSVLELLFLMDSALSI